MELRLFMSCLALGGSQTDIATLTVENIIAVEVNFILAPESRELKQRYILVIRSPKSPFRGTDGTLVPTEWTATAKDRAKTFNQAMPIGRRVWVSFARHRYAW